MKLKGRRGREVIRLHAGLRRRVIWSWSTREILLPSGNASWCTNTGLLFVHYVSVVRSGKSKRRKMGKTNRRYERKIGQRAVWGKVKGKGGGPRKEEGKKGRLMHGEDGLISSARMCECREN
jgi:hypothetical protein